MITKLACDKLVEDVGLHNALAVSSEKYRGTATGKQVTRTENLMTFGHTVFEICELTDIRTDRQTERHADSKSLHLCRGRRHHIVGLGYAMMPNDHQEW